MSVQKKEEGKKRVVEEVLSEEDQQMKERIDNYVTILLDQSSTVDQIRQSIELLKKEVKESTTTMTSVPKPFKFIKEHYEPLVEHYRQQKEKGWSEVVSKLADIMSILAMSFSDKEQVSLEYLLESSQEEVTEWGYGYMSHLAGEIGRDYQARLQQGQDVHQLIHLVHRLVPKLIDSNAETEAIDLLLEVDQLSLVKQYYNQNNCQKMNQYLLACSQYASDPEEMEKILEVNLECLLGLEQFSQALRMGMKLESSSRIVEVVETLGQLASKDNSYKLVFLQLGYDLTRVRNATTLLADVQGVHQDLLDQFLEIVSNRSMTTFYHQLAKDLDVLEPKAPNQIYKEDKDNQIDSAKINLANTYVNAFVNLGSGKDTLMINTENKDGPWIYKLKNEGLIAGSGSIGMVCMWDLDKGSEHIAEYLELKDGYGLMGSLIGVGLYSQSVHDECDQAKALLVEKLEDKQTTRDVRLGALMGLGLAYAGSHREDLLDVMVPLVIDPSYGPEINAMASLALGTVYLASRHEEAANVVLQALMEENEDKSSNKESWGRMMGLSLGLLFMGQQDKCEPILEATELIASVPLKGLTQALLKGCAYVDSGNVLQVQGLMHQVIKNMEKVHCNAEARKVLEKEEEEEEQNKEEQMEESLRKEKREAREVKQKELKEDDRQVEQEQLGCILGIALIASSESIGGDIMAVRQLNHLYQLGDLGTRRAVPLALALLHVSNPKIPIMDTLNKMAHDQDSVLSQRAILALGLVGLGSNNSRLAGLLRSLSWYYGHDANFVDHYYLCKVSQGLLHSGKGLVTGQFHHSDRFLTDKVGLAGLLIFLVSLSDLKLFVHGKHHYFLFFLALAIKPRYMFTLDEHLQPKPVQVRVGQAVDYVAQAGKPKKITGFQTHTSPVIISNTDRAELASDEFIPVADVILENIVILKKNPDYQEEEKK